MENLIKMDNKIPLRMKVSRLANLRDRKRKLCEKMVSNNDPNQTLYLKGLIAELSERIINLHNHIISGK